MGESNPPKHKHTHKTKTFEADRRRPSGFLVLPVHPNGADVERRRRTPTPGVSREAKPESPALQPLDVTLVLIVVQAAPALHLLHIPEEVCGGSGYVRGFLPCTPTEPWPPSFAVLTLESENVRLFINTRNESCERVIVVDCERRHASAPPHRRASLGPAGFLPPNRCG